MTLLSTPPLMPTKTGVPRGGGPNSHEVDKRRCGAVTEGEVQPGRGSLGSVRSVGGMAESARGLRVQVKGRRRG